jgi:ATP-dependent helicase/nuclease subunit B
MTRAPGLYAIPAGVDFVRELAKGMVARFAGAGPFGLADCLVLLPTRRACRALEEAFAASADAPGRLLPRVRALGALTADDWETGDLAAAGAPEPPPPPASPLSRLFALTEMVLEWEGRSTPLAGERLPRDPALALGLAQDLAALLDAAALEEMDWSKLAALAPPDLAGHWERTVDFLRTLTVSWPQWLAEQGLDDPAAFRVRQLNGLAAAWRAGAPPHPVVIAGSTGSVKATARLMRATMEMAQGAVILPGLDLNLDAGVWDALGPDHPQFVMRELLKGWGMTRGDVRPWTDAAPSAPRARLLSEVMRPAASAEGWPAFVEGAKADAPEMVRGLTYVESANPQEEAVTVALALKSALAAGQSAALVTPNRNLARRVAVELRRWGVAVDDSAGRPLSKTPLGALLTGLCEAVTQAFAPAPLLALLKHPLAALGLGRDLVLRRTWELEVAALRGPRPAQGLAGIRRAAAVAGMTAAAPLLDALDHVCEPLCAEAGDSPQGWAARLRRSVERAAAPGGDPWADDAGREALVLLAEVEEAVGTGLMLDLGAFARLFGRLMDARPVRPLGASEAAVAILGPLEARLQRPGLVVLGGLNEPGWPSIASVDGWLNRPMRAELGLSQPERRIGQSAHDFVEAASAPNAILSRAAKEEGGPANPSRWVVRLRTLAQALGVDGALTRTPLKEWRETVDRPNAVEPGEAPAPRPPLAARPRSLSVTQVEQWVRDPYAHYVRHILRLEPLDPIDADPAAAVRGEFVHAVFETFVKRFPRELPPDAPGLLRAIAEETIAAMAIPPGVAAVWRPRFVRMADWFLRQEAARRPLTVDILVERKGAWRLEDVDFTVKARADRIEMFRDGGACIVDYKTGDAPTQSQIEKGFSSQLPLEAAMLQAGAFADAPPRAAVTFEVWRLTGKDEGGKVSPFKNHDGLIADAVAGLRRRVRAFDDPRQEYRSRPHVKFVRKGDEYGFIARAAERIGQEEEGE